MNPIPPDSSRSDYPVDSRDCIDLVYDGPGDNTVRPLRPKLRQLALAEREKTARWRSSNNGAESADNDR
jgi:hypothetical protein